jgi:hypothetical protein
MRSAAVGLSLILLLAAAGAAGADGADGAWIAGAEAAAFIGPFVDGDPYAYPAGLGAFAIAEGLLPAQLVAGAAVDWFAFAPLENRFGPSSMIVASLEAARAVWGHTFEQGGGMGLEPFVRIGQYVRWHSLDSRTYVRARPLAVVGARLRIAGDRRLDCSLSVGCLALIEQELRGAILIESRAGLRLGGGPR